MLLLSIVLVSEPSVVLASTVVGSPSTVPGSVLVSLSVASEVVGSEAAALSESRSSPPPPPEVVLYLVVVRPTTTQTGRAPTGDEPSAEPSAAERRTSVLLRSHAT